MVTGQLGWYYLFAHGKIKREYALLHVAERVTGIKSTDHLLDEELREILIDRDDITEARFEKKIKNCVVLDLDYFVPPEEFAEKVAKPLSKRLKIDEKQLYKSLIKREQQSNIMVRPGKVLFIEHLMVLSRSMMKCIMSTGLAEYGFLALEGVPVFKCNGRRYFG